MKVLELSSSYHPETFILEHVNVLNHYKANSIIFAHPSFNVPAQSGVSYKIYDAKNINRWARMFGKLFRSFPKRYSLYKNKAFITRIKPSLIHFHFGWSAVSYSHHIEQFKLPYTISIRGSDLFIRPLFDEIYKKKLANLLEQASGIHVVSENLKDYLVSNYNINCTVRLIRTPIDVKKWEVKNAKFKSTDTIKVTAIGRLHWVKDFTELILQFAKVSQNNNTLELTIIGSGPEKEKLLFLIDKFNLKDQVKLVGYQSSEAIAQMLKISNIFVLTSWSEGFPNVLVEAALAKNLCIVPNHLKIEQVFSEKQVVYYDKMVPNNLSEKLLEVITMDLEAIDKMTSEAQMKSIELFNSDRHAKDFFDFFEEAIGRC